MFFTYDQNNSGGGFDVDEEAGISVYVIVEAEDYATANERAEAIGLYFDGEGDCSCCGNRWSAQWSGTDGDAVPSIYGEPVETAVVYTKWVGTRPDAFVHYVDGRVVAHHLPKKSLS
ncbi:hypothetical protein NPS70_16430 [Streptomyces sp. C10-9-1]|uniref:DUF7296 family protein n=1 Tax=Streptomyces sp. C10-9-1 TaxID=1859285 RepID=UPI0021115EEF|nr:hypothetical protein [Streptomyces sp. C10-9-1]MCQ6554773.1 hypothetical protein [Streptomyces sp. C10-9-1]